MKVKSYMKEKFIDVFYTLASAIRDYKLLYSQRISYLRKSPEELSDLILTTTPYLIKVTKDQNFIANFHVSLYLNEDAQEMLKLIEGYTTQNTKSKDFAEKARRLYSSLEFQLILLGMHRDILWQVGNSDLYLHLDALSHASKSHLDKAFEISKPRLTEIISKTQITDGFSNPKKYEEMN